MESAFKAIRPKRPAEVTNFAWGEDKVVLQSRLGEWWMATGNGILRYPRVMRPDMLAHSLPKALYRQADGLTDDGVTRVFEDHQGDIWIGTAFGLAHWQHTTGEIKNDTQRLQLSLGHAASPLSFAEDRNGDIWIGFAGGGMVRIRDRRMESICDGLPQGSINSLLLDHNGRLWVASSLAGLALINEPKADKPVVQSFADKPGFRSKHLFALTEDTAGRIYVAGGQGVDRFDPASGAIDYLDTSSGLPLGETQRLFCDHRGYVWFASNFGLSRLLPTPDQNGRPADPVVHEVRVSGVPVAASDEGELHLGPFRLSAGNNSIEISYGSVDFSPDHRIRYRYHLSPVETAWHEPTAMRSAAYVGVGPGSYLFQVQGMTSAGALSPHVASVEFHIDPPLWQTWWFLMLSGAAVVMLVFTWQVYRVRQMLAMERVRAHLAADLHDDLGSGLAEIAILTEVAKQEGETQGLEVVAQRARELRGSLGDIAWSVDPKFDNVGGFVRQCRQTSYRLLGDQALEFSAPEGEGTLAVSLMPAQRRHLFLLFKEMVTNVARHARATRVRVEIRVTGHFLHFTVADNGCGFELQREQGGSGLQNMYSRAAALAATLAIHSSPDNGTTVHLQAPLRGQSNQPTL